MRLANINLLPMDMFQRNSGMYGRHIWISLLNYRRRSGEVKVGVRCEVRFGQASSTRLDSSLVSRMEVPLVRRCVILHP